MHTAGAGDGKLKVDVKGPGGVEEEVVVKKEAASVYACHYKPSKVGEYVVSATFSEQPIFKSPFNVDVAPERPTKIRAYGPGLHSGVSGHPTSFIVETNGETGGLGALLLLASGMIFPFILPLLSAQNNIPLTFPSFSSFLPSFLFFIPSFLPFLHSFLPSFSSFLPSFLFFIPPFLPFLHSFPPSFSYLLSSFIFFFSSQSAVF